MISARWAWCVADAAARATPNKGRSLRERLCKGGVHTHYLDVSNSELAHPISKLPFLNQIVLQTNYNEFSIGYLK